MTKHLQRLRLAGACCVLLAAGIAVSPAAAADGCPPGFITNPYNGQCFTPQQAPTINGIPCVVSKLGTCLSFQQNQQPPRRPSSSIG